MQWHRHMPSLLTRPSTYKLTSILMMTRIDDATSIEERGGGKSCTVWSGGTCRSLEYTHPYAGTITSIRHRCWYERNPVATNTNTHQNKVGISILECIFIGVYKSLWVLWKGAGVVGYFKEGTGTNGGTYFWKLVNSGYFVQHEKIVKSTHNQILGMFQAKLRIPI